MKNENEAEYYKKIIFKIVIVLLIVLGVFISYKIAMFYIPFIIAFIISSIVEPMIKLITRKTKLKRKVACVISLIIATLLICVIFMSLSVILIKEATILISNLNIYFKNAYDLGIEVFNDIQEGRITVPQEAIEVGKQSLAGFLDVAKTFVGNLLKGLVETVTSIPTILTYGFITILSVIFICFDREYIIEQVKKHVPKIWLGKAKEIFNEMVSVSFKYIKAESKLSLLCFALVFIGLNLFNIFGLKNDYPVIMAILIGFVDLLPIFGAGTVMIPWSIILIIRGNLTVGIAVIILWCVWAMLKQLLEPKMISKQMAINPIFTLIGMYTGFRLIGVFGMILGPIVLLVCKNVFGGLINRGILKTFFELE
jgi:sporulation integral membrane protein YtvI